MNEEISKIEILLEEYRMVSMIFNTNASGMQKQITYFGIYFTFLGGLLAYIFFSNNFSLHSAEVSYQFLALLLISVSIIFFYTVITNLFELIGHMYYQEFRISAIERKINNIYGEDLLVYDSVIMKNLHDVGFMHLGIWFNPSYFYGSFLVIFLMGITALHWMLCFKFAPSFLTIFVDITAFISIFVPYQLWLFTSMAGPYIRNNVMKWSGLPHDELSFDSQKGLLIIPLITMIVGWLSFVTLSISQHVFFSHPENNSIGLVTNGSVFIGDLFLLPVFNYMLFDLIIYKITPSVFIKNNRSFAMVLLIFLLISIGVNWETHVIWSSDRLNDFISVQVGVLSIGGWWHLIFSIIEMVMVELFLYGCWVSAKNKLVASYAYCQKIFIVSLIFSSLQFVDFCSKYFQFDRSLNFFHQFFYHPMHLISPSITLICFVVYLIVKKGIVTQIPR